MTAVLTDAIGLGGSALFIAAFIYVNVAREINKRWYNAANLLGSIMLLISLSVHFNLAATVLESVWGLIALLGLVRSYWGKGSTNQ